MSAKRYCIVASTWRPGDLAEHFPDARGRQECHDRSHRHLTRPEVHELEADDLVEWIHRPENRRDLGILRVRRLEIPPARGLSCRVGAEIAQAVYQRLLWARTMLAEIQSPTGF